jgi:transcriptional regulator with GAF, ATPase, and Fis domain
LALAAPLALVSASSARAFVDFDECIVSAQVGVTLVRAPADVHGPIVAHAARRLRTSGFHPIDAAVRTGAPLFREVAMHLGLGTVPVDPSACAEAILAAAAGQHAAIVASLPADGTWDHAVAVELAKAPRVRLVFVTTGDASGFADSASVFEVASALNADEKLRWLSAIAEEAQNALPAADLRSLEVWWAKARCVVPEAAPTFDDLSEGARAVLTCIALAGRSLPVVALTTLLASDITASVDALVAAGLASSVAGLVSVAPSTELSALETSATKEICLAVAACLMGEAGGFNPDPWAFARAAELLVAAGAYDAADAAISKALKTGSASHVTSEIAARWFDVVTPITGSGGVTLRVKAAERALLVGEASDAQRWCESAAALEPSASRISLLLGRALIQLGDLVAARVCLAKAEANAPADDNELTALVAVERAEVSYLSGELEQAAASATRALHSTTSAPTRLAARSTLGKLLLARGAWEEADAHFAEDALVASAAGEITAELRARLNRAIAMLSKGRLDEARTMLEGLLEDATHFGEERARAYALANLAVVAYRQHDYATALVSWEQTIRAPQALRGRLATAHTIGNLAALRLRLGLVEHAEHAIAFGKKLLSGSTLPKSSALYKEVSAQIALARGNTELARREIESALVDAQASGDRDFLETAYLVSARVALEDGDLGAADIALKGAEKVVTSARARAELAIVRAALLRSMGQPAIESASEALVVARACGEEDLLSEIHTLLAMLYRDAGDNLAAQAHCSRAVAVRDQVASNLPADIRAAFLAKAEAMALSRLQSSLASDAEAEEEAPRAQRIVARDDSNSSREMVGDDPAIRSLAVAIKKVASSSIAVLIRGESGTGKELVAEALHRAGDRASGPLVSVNCAALVETLLLSELFGHEKGAFTGASARRRGRFEMAEGGTLFLDEIGDISPRTQVALLRVLQEKTFERVGGTTPIRANVRVVCATHRDLRAMVGRGEFREDLYYRLRGITLEVPALRLRLGDLPKVAAHLLGRIALERGEQTKRLSSDAVDLLCRHRWPGNVRELENVLRAVSLFAEGNVITASAIIENVDDLRAVARNVERVTGPVSQPPTSLRGGATTTIVPPPSGAPSSLSVDGDDDEGDGLLPEDEANATAVAYAQVRQGTVSLSDIKRQIERDCIARALAETKGNITRAAALLGMKRPRLSQLVKQYGFAAASSEGNT